MTVVVSWSNVFPDTPSLHESDRHACNFNHLTGLYLAHRLAYDPEGDRIQEAFANSTYCGYDALEDLAEQFPDNHTLHGAIATICEDSGWVDEALVHLRAAVALRPRWLTYRHRLGRVLAFKLGRVTAAIAELRFAAFSSPRRPSRDLLVDLAKLQLEVGDIAGARETAALHRDHDPYEPFAVAVLAVCAQREGGETSGREYANEAAALLARARFLDSDQIEEVDSTLASLHATAFDQSFRHAS